MFISNTYFTDNSIVEPGYCHLKHEVAALNWCWCCHVVFWSMLHPPPIYQSRSQ